MIRLLATAVALLGFVACSSKGSAGGAGGSPATSTSGGGGAVDGGDAPPDAPADSEAGACALVRPYSTQNALCNGCAEASCCALVNACLNDVDCDMGYVDCELACTIDFDAGADAAADAGPTACLLDCAKQYPKGKTEYDAAIGCVDQACATECM